MRHAKHIDGYIDRNQDLARDITDMRYKELAELLEAMGDCFALDCMKDQSRGRKQLSDGLERMTTLLTDASIEMQKIWEICEPYMEDDHA